ncbi:hypothetical protein Dimus_039618 [Dionaea muscipula]
MRGFGMIPSWLNPESIGYLISFIIKAKEAYLRPTLSSFQTMFQLIHKETGYFSFKPRPGYCPIFVLESPDTWKQRFVLVSSSDWDEFQPPMIPNSLDPTPSHLLSKNDKWMLTVYDAGIGTVPRLHEVATLENLEDYHIATVLHPRGTWAKLRALYGENSYLNGHPTLYEFHQPERKMKKKKRRPMTNTQMEGIGMTLIDALFYMFVI